MADDVKEIAIPWEAIPAEASNWLHIRVPRFKYEVGLREKNPRVAMWLYSYWDNTEGYHEAMWLLEFDLVWAFRMSGSAFWFRRLPVPQPPPEQGLWEIVHSHWLSAAVESNGQRSPADVLYPLHHFAIVEETVALYEVIASSWTSKRLSAAEAAPFLE